MVALILSLLGALRSALRTHVDLAIENLALRQQLANLRRTSSRPRLRNSDRAFWLVLSRFWSRWVDVLVVVKPDTVVRWHRAGFRLFWRWKSRSGSPSDGGVSQETKLLIRQIAEFQRGLGRAQNSRRIAEARHRRAKRVPLHAAQATEAALPNLAHLPRQPCRLAGIDRFLHGSHGDVSRSVCLLRLGPRPPPRSSLQHHRAPQRGLDRPTDRRGLPRGHGAEVHDPRPRLHLRRPVPPSRPGPRHRGNPHGTAVALAESIC